MAARGYCWEGGAVAVGGKGALMATGTRGAGVAARADEDTLHDIFFTDERTGWVACERSIFKLKTKEEHRSYLLKTEDGGESWRRVLVAGADVDARLVRVRFADREHGWAFGEMGALYATVDGGETWARQRVPPGNSLGACSSTRGGFGSSAHGANLLQNSEEARTWLAAQLVGQDTPRPSTSTASGSLGPALRALQRGLLRRTRRGWR